jgi:putative PIN family toxin of toxin-antitoxin system
MYLYAWGTRIRTFKGYRSKSFPPDRLSPPSKELVFSFCDTVSELREVLVREDKPFKLSKREAEQIVTEIRNFAEVIEIKHKLAVCKDEMDNRVLECAKDGKASFVISGDQHLLDLKSFRGVRIMTVSEFLHNLKGDSVTTGV